MENGNFSLAEVGIASIFRQIALRTWLMLLAIPNALKATELSSCAMKKYENHIHLAWYLSKTMNYLQHCDWMYVLPTFASWIHTLLDKSWNQQLSSKQTVGRNPGPVDW